MRRDTLKRRAQQRSQAARAPFRAGRSLVLDITGGIACGKSSVLRHLSRCGAATISADTLAHSCINKGTPAYRKIVRHFGAAVLTARKDIDRSKLGEIVFTKRNERVWLERVVHPCVVAALKRFIRRHHGVLALDIPLLYEAGLRDLVDVVVVVSSTRQQQLKRLMSRSFLTRRQALLRIRSQLPLSFKRRAADYVIDNTRDRESLAQEVRKFWTALKNS